MMWLEDAFAEGEKKNVKLGKKAWLFPYGNGGVLEQCMYIWFFERKYGRLLHWKRGYLDLGKRGIIVALYSDT